MDINSIRVELRSFILGSFLFTDDESELTDSQSLLETSVVDSTGILELVMFLEESYAIKVDDAEMLPENLDSVDAICSFAAEKISRKSA